VDFSRAFDTLPHERFEKLDHGIRGNNGTSVRSSRFFFHLRCLRSVRHQLGKDVTGRLDCALVLSRLDYCNVVRACLPASTLALLQHVLHVAATSHAQSEATLPHQFQSTTTALDAIRSAFSSSTTQQLDERRLTLLTYFSQPPPLHRGPPPPHHHWQGRRHGFESGGQFCERSEQKKIFDPPLFGHWGDKILLR